MEPLEPLEPLEPMEHIRTSIVQAQVVCTEYDVQVPSRILDENEFSGTCFRVDPSLFPFGDKVLFLTNFHVCDNADDRVVHLRTAGMGRTALTGYVEAVVPQLDCALISLSTTHEKWFLNEDPQTWIDRITIAPLQKTRITSKTQKVSTIGFPQGLEEQLSSGWLAGRGSDDMDMLQLNISINSGNSGGPLCDENGQVIGICTATLNESEGIAFAVPIFSVLAYFAKFYKAPYGRFPAWGLDLMPMTDAYAAEFAVAKQGAVVRTVQPGSIAYKHLKPGDVIHKISSGGPIGFEVELDCFGLIHDETRGSKITINNTEFLMRLEPGNVVVEYTRRKRLKHVAITPAIIDYQVVERFKEWNPLTSYEFGPMVLQNLTQTLLMDEDTPAAKVVELLEHIKLSKCMEEVVIISHIQPRSYVSNLELPLEYDVVLKVGRYPVKNMQKLKKLLENVKIRWLAGEQKRVCLTTTSGAVWLTLAKMGWTNGKRKRIN